VPAAKLSSLPPPPLDAANIERVEHTRLRRRIMYGRHESDLRSLLHDQLGSVRADAWGNRPDMSANPFQSLWTQASMLYAVEPEVGHDDDSGRELLARVAEAGYWALMQRVQRDTLGFREMFLRVTVDHGALVFRPVFPDMVEAKARAQRPSQPLIVGEWEEHADFEWVRRTADAVSGTYTVQAHIDGVDRDVSGEVLGDHDRAVAAAHILPYSVFHAAETGWLFDAWTSQEVVCASLWIGLYLTEFGHVMRNASWPQRYAAGVVVEGAGVDGARQEVVTDPATVLLLGVREGAQPMVGQWGSPADPEAILRAVAMYERRALQGAGLHPPDVTRQSADIRSGYSLAVARESVREQQRFFAPQFLRGDRQTLRLCAALLNEAEGRNYPLDGYQIRYRGLPPSPAEDRLRIDTITALLDRGVITTDEARERLGDVLARV